MKLSINKFLIYFLVLLKINFFSWPRNPIIYKNILNSPSSFDYDILKEDYAYPLIRWTVKDSVQTIGFYGILKYFFGEKSKNIELTLQQKIDANEIAVNILNGAQNRPLSDIEKTTKITALNTEITNLKDEIKNKYLINYDFLKIPSPVYLFNKKKRNLIIFAVASFLNFGQKYLVKKYLED